MTRNSVGRSIVPPWRGGLIATSILAMLALLLHLAYRPWWRSHLQVDVVTFWYRALHFLRRGTWQDIDPRNEYQAGALWIFVGVGALSSNVRGSFESYVTAAVLHNMVLLVASAVWLWHACSPRAALIWAGLALAAGPILLYRFEVLTGILVAVAWHGLAAARFERAAFLLGLASAIKLYPIVLAPILLLEIMRHGSLRRVPAAAAAGLLGALLPVALLLTFGGSVEDIRASVSLQGVKPIGLEGPWGNIALLAQLASGAPVALTRFGISGLAPDSPWLAPALLTHVWLVPYAVLLAWLWRRRWAPGDPRVPALVLMTFVLFAKVVNPQYLWWYVSLLPLAVDGVPRTRALDAALALTFAALAISQIVYPIRYTEFLAWFEAGGRGPGAELVALNVTRNVLLLAAFVLCWRDGQRSWHIAR